MVFGAAGDIVLMALRKPRWWKGSHAERNSRELTRFPYCFWTTGVDGVRGQETQIVQSCK